MGHSFLPRVLGLLPTWCLHPIGLTARLFHTPGTLMGVMGWGVGTSLSSMPVPIPQLGAHALDCLLSILRRWHPAT